MSEQELLNWLLAPDNPSARYLTLRYLLGCPKDDREVAKARAAIIHFAPVRAMLDAQYPTGYWMRPGRGYSPRYKGTIWQLLFFADLGVPPVEQVRRACEHVLTNALHPGLGLFSAHKHSTGIFPCLNGELLRAFWTLGYQDRIVAAVTERLARRVLDEGFICPRNGQHPRQRTSWQPCIWGCVKVLRGLAAVPSARRPPTVQRAIERGTSFLLSRDLARPQCPSLAPLNDDERDAWLHFGFPTSYAADLLEAAVALVEAGVRPPPEVVRTILQKRRPAGYWVLERAPSGTWAACGIVGRPNRWITWRALCVTAHARPETDC